MNIKIVSKLILPFGYGIYLPFNTILVRKDGNVPYLIAHEMEHHRQKETEGSYIQWLWSYLLQVIKYGYYDCLYEETARNAGKLNAHLYQNYAKSND